MTLLSIDNNHNNNCKNSQQENTVQSDPDRYYMNTSDQRVDIEIQGIYPGRYRKCEKWIQLAIKVQCRLLLWTPKVLTRKLNRDEPLQSLSVTQRFEDIGSTAINSALLFLEVRNEHSQFCPPGVCRINNAGRKLFKCDAFICEGVNMSHDWTVGRLKQSEGQKFDFRLQVSARSFQLL